MNTTDKSKLMHKLETFLVNPPKPVPTCVHIIDATFFLHLQKNPPMSFGQIAKCLLQRLATIAGEIHLVCDVYSTPSIKDTERDRRGNEDLSYNITGPDQIRPKDWQSALRSSSFKVALFNFLQAEWEKQAYAEVIQECNLYLAVSGECFCFTVEEDSIRKVKVEELKSHHEEADTRMIFHLDYVHQVQDKMDFVVRSCDTDVLVVLLFYVASKENAANVWLEVGIDSNNTRRMVSINNIVQNLGKDVCLAIPGLHALTGCDYTPAFLNKGKVKPFDLMIKHKTFIECMGSLGMGTVSNEMVSQFETFLCHLYGQPKETSVNKARHLIFQKTYAPKSLEDPLSSIKGVNPSALPPCSASVLHQVRRANYVAGMWKRADQQNPCVESPVGHGWCLVNNVYQIHWYDGAQLQQDIYRALDTSTGEIQVTAEQEDEVVTYGELLYGQDETYGDDNDD